MTAEVLVIGGGFAGLESAINLSKGGMRVTLVSDRDFLYIYPISIWIPVHKINFADACLPLTEVAARHGFELVVDGVSELLPQESRVHLKSGVSLSYDYLVVAIGSAKMRPKGVENTMSICGAPQDIIPIRERLDQLVERGHGRIAVGFGGNPKDPSAVRGGPGFEFLFNLRHYLKKKKVLNNFKLTLFAPMPKPGIRLGDKAYAMLVDWVDNYGIERRFGKKIKEFTPEGVTFADDSTLESDFTMFIPAGKGHPVLTSSGLPANEAGFLEIDDHCRVKGQEKIFAVGDSAAIKGPEWRAKQGHLAEVMAQVAAQNILDLNSGRAPSRGYERHVSILCVMDFGNGAAYVSRDADGGTIRPLPVVGHWLKRAWGGYWKLHKKGRIPRIPGL